MASLAREEWTEAVSALPNTTATRLGPLALDGIQRKFTSLQVDAASTTHILRKRLQWAKSTSYLRVNSDTIPTGVLKKGWKGIIHEIKVNPRGYGKRKGPPTDDAVYEGEEKVRRLVPRGCCFVELFLPTKDGPAADSSLILPGVFAMRKFSGGLGDEDDDSKNGGTSTTTAKAVDRWAAFFTRPIEDAKVVVCAKKANGEAAHFSCVRLPDGTLLKLCGSKHVHIAYIDTSHIELYQNSDKHVMAMFIASTFERTPAAVDVRYLNMMADTGLTACFEIERPDSMHVEMFDFELPRLAFLAFTSNDIGTADGEKETTRTTNDERGNQKEKIVTLPSVGQCLPPAYGYLLASTFGLTPVPYQIHSTLEVERIIREVRGRHGDEGDVLYFVAEDGETIGLVKTKTVWYTVARAIREKMRTMVSKATKIREGKPVKGFWNPQQGIVAATGGGGQGGEGGEGEKKNDSTSNTQSKKKKSKKKKKKNKTLEERGTQYVAPSIEDVLSTLCERTVCSVQRRIVQLQVWLKFNDDVLSKYDVIGASFIRWAMQEFIGERLALPDVASAYPVLWLRHLKFTGLDDKFSVKLIGEKDLEEELVEEKKKEEEEEEEGLSCKPMTEGDFTTFQIGSKEIRVTTRVAPQFLTPLFDDAWTGSHVWGCSIHLSTYLLERLTAEGQDAHRIVELGAGVGLVSAVCALAGSSVVCTDQSMLIETMEANRVANNIERSQFESRELTWSEVNSTTFHSFFEGTYDVVLCSDCLNPVYGTQNIPDLANALLHMIYNESVVCYIAYEERGEGDEETSLLRAMVDVMGLEFETKVVHVEDSKIIYRLRRVGSTMTL